MFSVFNRLWRFPVAMGGRRIAVAVSLGLAFLLASTTPAAADPPSIFVVSPGFGPVGGGTTVAIQGLHFTGTTAVRFGSAQAATFRVDSDSQITVTSPNAIGTIASGGQVVVSVTNPDGTSPAPSNVSQTFYYFFPLGIISQPGGALNDYFGPGSAIILGSSYLQSNSATDGWGPFRFSVAGGALPAGTRLDTSLGLVEGQFTALGPYSYTIRVVDSEDPAPSATGVTVSGTVVIGQQLISWSTLQSPVVFPGPPVTLSATTECRAPVAFTSLTTAVCTVSGNSAIPVAPGVCSITASAGPTTGPDNLDGLVCSAPPNVTQSFTVIRPSLSLLSGPTSGTFVGQAFSQSYSVSGGVPPYTFGLAPDASALPSGTSVNPTTGLVAGVATSAGGYGYRILVSDSQSPPATAGGPLISGSILKNSQSISFPSPPNIPLTALSTTISATASSGLPVAFSSATPSVCSVSGSTVSLLAGGTCTIHADEAGSTAYSVALEVTRSFTVTSTPLSVAAGAPTGAFVGGPYHQTNAAAGGVGPYAYTLASGAVPSGTNLNASTGEVSGTPTAAQPFAYQIMVTDSAPTPAQASGTAVTGVIASTTQLISFVGPANTPLSASTVSVSATASSGLPVTFSSGSPGVCAISGTTVMLRAIGLCTILADQVGDATYAAAPQVSQSFAVTAEALSLTSGAPSSEAVGGSYSQNNTASGGVPPYTYAVASGTLPPGVNLNGATGIVSGTLTTSGSFIYQIKVTDIAAPAATATGASVEADVEKGSQSIGFTPFATRIAMGTPVSAVATASSHLAVTFSSTTPGLCTVSGASVTLLSTGTCTIVANQPGDANWNAAPQVTQSFVIAPPVLRITAGPPMGTFRGAGYSQSNMASGGVPPYTFFILGQPPLGTSLDTTTGLVWGTPTQAATYSYAVQVRDSELPPVTVPGGGAVVTITGGARPQTLSFPPVGPASLSSSPITLNAAVSSGLILFFSASPSSVCANSGPVVVLLAAGVCSVTVFQPGNDTYAPITPVTQSFQVLASSSSSNPLSLTTGPPNGLLVGAVYNQYNSASGGSPTYAYALESGALPPGLSLDAATGLVSGAPSTTGAFFYQIAVTDHQSATATGDFVNATITPAIPVKTPQTINFPTVGAVLLSSSPLTLHVTATSGLPVELDGSSSICKVSGTTVTLTFPGTCLVVAFQAGDTTYAPATPLLQEFEVLASPPGPTTLSLTVGPAQGAFVGGAYSQSNTASGGLQPYRYSLVTGSLPPGVTLNTATGLVSGSPTDAGLFNYQISVTDNQFAQAYNGVTRVTISASAPVLTKTPQTISFLPPSVAKLSNSPITLNITASSGLAVNLAAAPPSVCTTSGTTVVLVSRGFCSITASQDGNETFAAATPVTQSLQILPDPPALAVGPPPAVFVGGSYRQANTASGGSPPYNFALASGDLPPGVSLDTTTGLVSGAPSEPGVFTYRIRVTDSQSTSTTGDTVRAIVTAPGAKTPQIIDLAEQPAASLLTSPLTITATASSGLTVTLSSATTDVCTVTGATVVLHQIGTCVIMADQAGDDATDAAPTRYLVFTVTDDVPPVPTLPPWALALMVAAMAGAGWALDAASAAQRRRSRLH